MEQPAIADQTAEFMELLQKAGELGRRRQGNAIAKAMVASMMSRKRS